MHRLLQFTLDLFDPAPSPPAASSPHAPSPAPKTKARKAPPVATPPAPTERFDQLLQPGSFRHPRANREAVLGNSVVAFEFKRARRRNIGFMVGPEGLTVSAPNWVPLYEIDAAVLSKERWILKKLDEVHERERRIESARIDW